MCNAHAYIRHTPARQEDFFPSWSNTRHKTLRGKVLTLVLSITVWLHTRIRHGLSSTGPIRLCEGPYGHRLGSSLQVPFTGPEGSLIGYHAFAFSPQTE